MRLCLVGEQNVPAVSDQLLIILRIGYEHHISSRHQRLCCSSSLPLKFFLTNILLQLNSHLPHLYSIRRPKFWPCLMEMFMVPPCFPSCDTPFCIDRVSPAYTLSHLPVEAGGRPGENNRRAYWGAAPGRQEFWGESVLVGGYHIWKNQIKAR